MSTRCLSLSLLACLLFCYGMRSQALDFQPATLFHATAAGSSFVDDSGLLSAQEIASPTYLRLFQPLHHARLHAGYPRYGVWWRLPLRNPQAMDTVADVIVDKASIAILRCYVAAPSQPPQLLASAGSEHSPVAGMLPGHAYIFRVPLPAHAERVVYLYMRSQLTLDPQILVADDYTAGRWQAQQSLVLGLAWGVLLTLVLVNIFAYLRAQQIANIDYAGFLCCLLLYSASAAGYLGLEVLPYPGWQNHIELASLLVLLVLSLRFMQDYLDIKRHLPVVHNILSLELGMLLLLVLSMPILPMRALARMSAEAALFVALSTLLVAALALVRRLPQARVYFWATLPTAVLALFGSLLTLGGASFSPALLPWLLVSVLLQGLIIILHMAMRAGHLRRQLAQMSQTLQRCETSLNMRTRFIKHISHEMRTPMSGILGMTELLRDTPLTPRQREYANTIDDSTQSLLRILNDLLDFATRDSDNFSLVEEPIELSSLLDDCLAIFRNLAEDKQLELIGGVDPRLPTHVIGDPTRLRQVMTSLLRNALRHTQRGDIELRLLPGDDHTLRCEVHDTGIGIPKEQLRKIFSDPLSELDDQILDTHLGLTVCRQLIHRMGGSMGAESAEREGSCIWFELPLKVAAHPTLTLPENEAQLEGLRLLVVDDNPTMLRVIEQQASSWGMKVRCCDHGQQALALARNAATLGEPFAVIVLDQNMPGMSGLQLAAHIKEDPLITSDVLMLMLTGMRTAPTYTMASNVGIRRVLTKPVTVRQLKRAISEELNHIERPTPVDNPQRLDASSQLKQMRILIAEDNPLSQKVIRGMVLKLGAECSVVGNGKEAVEEISRRSYDVILMDCDMPCMDGYIATQSIREWERLTQRRPTPILALTGHILDEHQARSLEAGMNEHLSKPVELSELRAALLRWSTY